MRFVIIFALLFLMTDPVLAEDRKQDQTKKQEQQEQYASLMMRGIGFPFDTVTAPVTTDNMLANTTVILVNGNTIVPH